jgi:hypothetical protein
MTDFQEKLEQKVRKQLYSQRVGYLLGAGSSYLNGNGYPLMTGLWDLIREEIPSNEQAEIQAKLDDGAEGIEAALDLLDDGGINDTPHRHLVTQAIAKHFCGLTPSLDVHAAFLKRISKRSDEVIPLFNLNYDPLFERAAELSKLRLIDGFIGVENAYYDSNTFQQRIGVARRSWRGRQFSIIQGNIHLYKLHGSLGWYESQSKGVLRCGFDLPIPVDAKRLMIPPQRRKATDTMSIPYSSLWTELRAFIRHGPYLINRLVSIGYGMRDGHVNDVIENGLVRSDLTLMIFARDLIDDVFNRWSPKNNVIIVTNDRSSLNGELGPGHPSLWNFEQLSKEV